LLTQRDFQEKVCHHPEMDFSLSKSFCEFSIEYWYFGLSAL